MGLAREAKVGFVETVGAVVGLAVAETETVVGFFFAGPVVGLGTVAAVVVGFAETITVGAIVGPDI